MNQDEIIKTLALDKLLEREKWRSYSLDNVYEIADQGHLGLYIKPYKKRKRSHDIQYFLNHLINADTISEVERAFYIKLYQKFLVLVKEHPYLFEYTPGYERLATSLEIKIFQLSDTGSIKRIIEDGKIPFFEFNNTFGIVKENGQYIARSYLLHCTSNEIHPLPTGYKGYYSKEDIIVFIEQVRKIELKLSPSIVPAFPEPDEDIKKEKFIFSKRGNFYSVTFKDITVTISISVGARYIEYIIKNPQKQIPCLALIHVNSSFDVNESLHDENDFDLQNQGICEDAFGTVNLDTIIDNPALKAYKRRLQKIKEDIDDANEVGDLNKVEALKNEQDLILNEIRVNTDIKGRRRKFSNPQDNARTSVTKAIKRALEEIKKTHPLLYEHLNSYLKKGGHCCYCPADKIIWE